MIEYVIKLQIVGLQSKVLKVLRTGQNNINVNVSFLPKLVNCRFRILIYRWDKWISLDQQDKLSLKMTLEHLGYLQLNILGNIFVGSGDIISIWLDIWCKVHHSCFIPLEFCKGILNILWPNPGIFGGRNNT